MHSRRTLTPAFAPKGPALSTGSPPPPPPQTVHSPGLQGQWGQQTACLRASGKVCVAMESPLSTEAPASTTAGRPSPVPPQPEHRGHLSLGEGLSLEVTALRRPVGECTPPLRQASCCPRKQRLTMQVRIFHSRKGAWDLGHGGGRGGGRHSEASLEPPVLGARGGALQPELLLSSSEF